MAPKFKEVADQRFGRLVAKRRVESHLPNSSAWFCKCDCGGTITVLGSNLFNGNTRSCGCLFRESSVENGKKNALDAPSALASAKNRVLVGYKQGAEQRGLLWDIPEILFFALTQAPCFYCGESPNNEEKRAKARFVYNGIDRKDSALGYVESNVVPCCWPCNKLKGSLDSEEFMTRAAKITLRHPDMLDLVRSQPSRPS